MDKEKIRKISNMITHGIVGIAFMVVYMFPDPNIVGFFLTIVSFLLFAIFFVLIEIRNGIRKLGKPKEPKRGIK